MQQIAVVPKAEKILHLSQPPQKRDKWENINTTPDKFPEYTVHDNDQKALIKIDKISTTTPLLAF